MPKNSFPTFPKSNPESSFNIFFSRERLLAYKDSFTVSWNGLEAGILDDSMEVKRVYDTEGAKGPHFTGRREHPNEAFPEQPYIDTLNVWFDYEDENWWVYFFDGTPNSTFFYGRTTSLSDSITSVDKIDADNDAWYSDLEGGNNFELLFDPFFPEATIAGNLTITDTVYEPVDRSVFNLSFSLEWAQDPTTHLLLPLTDNFNRIDRYAYDDRGTTKTHFTYLSEDEDTTEFAELRYGVPIFENGLDFITPNERLFVEPQWYIYTRRAGFVETYYLNGHAYGNGDPASPRANGEYVSVGDFGNRAAVIFNLVV